MQTTAIPSTIIIK